MKKYLLNLFVIVVDILFLIVLLYICLYATTDMVFTSVSLMHHLFVKDFYFVIFIIIALMYHEKLYTLRYDFWQETKGVFKSLVLAYFIVLALLGFSKTSLEYSISFITIYFVSAMLFIPVSKRCFKKLIYKFAFFRKKVLIVANQEELEVFKKEFEQNWYLGMEYNQNSYEAVIICSKDTSIYDVNRSITKYLTKKRSVYVVPYVTEINFANSNIMEYSNIRYNTIQIENKLLNPQNIWAKNIFDFLVTLMLLPVFLFAHLFITILIKLDSDGAVFFKQYRLGKDDKDFLCYKYRTMYENSDKLLKDYLDANPDEVAYYEEYHKYKNDPRITKIGKILRATSLDELAQIINVLKGEMSLVGPRPYMVIESKKLAEFKEAILKVKPGITGLWQVSGRNNLTFKQRNELEIWYIKNWSLWADFVILIKTIKVVLSKVGAR